MNKRSLVLLAAIVLLATGVAVAFEIRSLTTHEDEGQVVTLGRLQAALAEIPVGVLTDQEKEALQATRSGAKVSRDLYAAYAAIWLDQPAFASNAFNEEVHLEAVALLLQRYGLEDPNAGRAAGTFASPQLQDLYKRFLTEGARSEVAAIMTATQLEELRLDDLRMRLQATDKDDLRLLYESLIQGKVLNMQSFAAAARAVSAPPYEPRYLSQAEFDEILATDPASLTEGSLLLRVEGRTCGLADVQQPQRRRRGTPSGTRQQRLQRRACSNHIDIAGSATRQLTLTSGQVQLRLFDAPMDQFPTPVDSNSPAFWQDGTLNIFNSALQETYRSSGDAVDNLANPVLVSLPVPERPGVVWLEAVWKDPDGVTLWGWYHFEPGDLPCWPETDPLIGAAVSYDGGLTWEDRGYVLSSAYEYNCDYDNGYFVGGHGDFSVILGPDGKYFYFLFSNYAGPAGEQGIGLARSPVADRGQPGTAMKYYQGKWEEPGIGGKVSAIFPSSTGWSGPFVDAFWGPSVHWNPYLKSYVAVMNRTVGENWAQEGVYMSFSSDLMKWTPPEKILNSNDWYPQVMGLGQLGTDSLAQRFLRLYVGGISTIILEFALPSAS